jgi:hypothetical protein
MWIAILLFTPTFAHWSDSGPTTAFYIVLVIGAIGGWLLGYEDRGWRSENSSAALTVITVIAVVVGIFRVFPVGTFQWGIGPNPCSVTDTRVALQQLLPIQESAALPDLAESAAEKISDERSLQLARNAQPQNLQLGE